MSPVIISIIILLLAVKTNSQNYKLSNRCFKDGQTYPTSHPNFYSKCFQSNTNFYEYEIKCRTLQYYNKNAQKCSRIPGGGSGVTQHETQICPANFIGLLSYQNHPEFYHVCGYGPHFVAQCFGGKIFDDSCQKCVPKKESVTIPIWDHAGANITVPKCEKLGTYSIENRPELYYKCFAGSYPIFYQELHKCGANATFDNQRKKCFKIQTPCYQKGCFGVPSNCTRYYNCKQLSNGTFRRRNYVCPVGKAFDALKRCCVPKNLAKCLGNLIDSTQQSMYDNEQVGNAAAYPEETNRAPLYTEESIMSTKEDILSTKEIKITTLVAENTEKTETPTLTTEGNTKMPTVIEDSTLIAEITTRTSKKPEESTPVTETTTPPTEVTETSTLTTEESKKMTTVIEDSTLIAEITSRASKEPEKTTLVTEGTDTTTLSTTETETPILAPEETVQMAAAIENSTLIAEITTRTSIKSEKTTLVTESTETITLPTEATDTPTLNTEEIVEMTIPVENSTLIAKITTNVSEKPEEITQITELTFEVTETPILAPKMTPAIEETTPIAEETKEPKETTVSIEKTENSTLTSEETSENSTLDTEETNSVKTEISILANESTAAETTEKTTLVTEGTEMTTQPIERIENTTVYPEETLNAEIENVENANTDNSKSDKHSFPNKKLEATIIIMPEIKTQRISLPNKPKNNTDDPQIISKTNLK